VFVGHLAVGLAAKRIEPKMPLGVLVAASFGIDLIWPLLVLAGIEVVRVDPGNTAFTALDFESYPWTHSLVMAVVWGTVAGLLVRYWLKSGRAGWIAGGVVVSHWVLDLITHRPDLPLWPGGTMLGLGLWNSIAGTLVVEGALFVAALVLYAKWTSPRDRVGRWALWGLPPPSSTVVAGVGLLMWLLPFWAQWIEGHREWHPPIHPVAEWKTDAH
jgi:hypothetical protein